VIVSGRLDVSDYQTKDGEKKKKHELIADAIGIELRFESVESYMVAEEVF